MVWIIQRLSSQRSRSPVGVAQLWNVRRRYHDDSITSQWLGRLQATRIVVLHRYLRICSGCVHFKHCSEPAHRFGCTFFYHYGERSDASSYCCRLPDESFPMPAMPLFILLGPMGILCTQTEMRSLRTSEVERRG
jgi:hypothetical protein